MCPLVLEGVARGAKSIPEGCRRSWDYPGMGQVPSGLVRMGTGIPQPQFPSCPWRLPCSGASSGVKLRCQAARSG